MAIWKEKAKEKKIDGKRKSIQGEVSSYDEIFSNFYVALLK